MERAKADLKSVLSTSEGRRMVMWLISHLQPEGNLWNSSAAITGFNAARHDEAAFLIDCIDQVDADAYLLMLQEKRAQEKYEAAEFEAVQLGRKRKPSGNASEPDEWE